MFRAIDNITGEELVSLEVDPNAPPVGHREESDVRPHDPLELRLRAWSDAGRLACRGCRAAVTFKRGWQRVAHFAHPASVIPCRHARATEAERNAALAALYAWARGKYGRADGRLAAHKVIVEHWPDEVSARHPIDLYVIGANEAFSYVLLDRRLRQHDRDAFERFAGVGGRLWPIGLGRRFRLWRAFVELPAHEYPDESETVDVELQPQEQWAVRQSRHALPPLVTSSDAAMRLDSVSGAEAALAGGVIHFLIPATDPPRPVPEGWEVVTIRLARPHVGRRERAVVRRSPLVNALVDPRDGGFVHPGEHERLCEWQRAVDAERQSLAERRERTRADMAKLMPQRLIMHRPPAAVSVPQPEALPPAFDPRSKLAVCRDCGQSTRDWWCYYGADGTCRCNACGGRTK